MNESAVNVGDQMIVIIDDDSLFRETLEFNLTEAGFNVTAFGDGAHALDYLLKDGDCALVLLDWRMPGLTGIQVLTRLQDAGFRAPVIFLTVLSEQMYEETALYTGALDFIEKSRSFSILKKRISLILDRPKGVAGAPPEHLETRYVGDLELDPSTHRAIWKGQHVDLTLTEYKLVHYLAINAGKDIAYRELYDQVRGAGFIAGEGEQGYRTNIRAFIKRVRQKFRDIDPDFDLIENYAGFGYRWIGNGDKANV